MPYAALKPCTWPGCPALCTGGRCDQHRRLQDQQRGSASARGYDSAWRKAREAWLRAHPLCACERCDEGRIRVTAATVVDHRIPHRGNKALFWDRNNWQSMAESCHNRKTATRDSSWAKR